jgi:hypothetical protein
VGLTLGNRKEEEGEPTTSTLRRPLRHTSPSNARSVSICHFYKQAERHLLGEESWCLREQVDALPTSHSVGKTVMLDRVETS